MKFSLGHVPGSKTDRDALIDAFEGVGVSKRSASRFANVLVDNGVTSVDEAVSLSFADIERWYGIGDRMFDALVKLGAVDDRPPAPMTDRDKLIAYELLLSDMFDYIDDNGISGDSIDGFAKRCVAIRAGDIDNI